MMADLKKTDTDRKPGRCIVVVEDNFNDLTLMKTVIEECGLRGSVIALHNGADAIAFFNRSVMNKTHVPGVIFLDLDLPGVPGPKLLQFLKSTPELANIPVVIFSDSNRSSDLAECRRLGAHSFFPKPTSFNDFKKTFTAMLAFWCNELGKEIQGDLVDETNAGWHWG